MRTLLKSIDAALNDIGHGWTTPEQAHCLAASVIALRPELSLEIGVFAGKGLVTLGLAHKECGSGKVIGIDPYSAPASVAGQIHPNDQAFWGQLDHDAIYRLAIESIGKFGLLNIVTLHRMKSDDFDVSTLTGLKVLRIDGNHSDQAVRDVERFAPCVVKGGLIFADDENWSGGGVLRACARLRQMGFTELYRVDQTVVFQRT